MVSSETDADLHDTIGDRLRQVDLRYTSGRRTVVEFLRAAGPVSITDIADRLPGLPRSSAYRHLVDLEAAGVVRRVAANDEYARFELAEDLTEHHHHLLCVLCGKVTDITPSTDFERAMTRHLADLASAEGFQTQSHRVDVLGICLACH